MLSQVEYEKSFITFITWGGGGADLKINKADNQ